MSSTVVPAPGEETFVSLALVNTLVSGSRGSFERLDGAESLAEWLAEHPMPAVTPRAGAGALASLKEVRSTLRRVLSARVHGDPFDPTDLQRLNRTAASVPVVPALRLDSGVAVEIVLPAGGADEAEAAISRDAIALLTSPSATHLKECHADDCDRLFLQSHGRSRWCSPACGNRARAARHYAKTRGAGV
jgi:predicted RNA-binding Zn ribbon-like protein